MRAISSFSGSVSASQDQIAWVLTSYIVAAAIMTPPTGFLAARFGRLAELAREQGLHEPFHYRLMDAYWSEATDIGDADELRRLAAEIGLPHDEVERAIEDPTAYLDRVEASTRQAFSLGVNAVPAFLLDRRLIVLGANPIETFRRAFAELAA